MFPPKRLYTRLGKIFIRVPQWYLLASPERINRCWDSITQHLVPHVQAKKLLLHPTPETLPTLEFPEDDVRYAIWQTEKCPETGRLHYQGYLSWRSRCVLWPLRICSPNSKARILSLGVVLETKPATTAARRRPRLTDPGSTAPLVPADRDAALTYLPSRKLLTLALLT